MKTIATLLILIGSCINVHAQSDKKIQIVKQYLEHAFNEEHDGQKALMHPDIIDYHPTILQEAARGRGELIKGWQETTKSMESVSYKNAGIGILNIIEGELVGEWVVTNGTITSNFMGMESAVISQMVGFYKVENGLITEVRNFGNILDIYQQLGYTLTAPKPKQ